MALRTANGTIPSSVPGSSARTPFIPAAPAASASSASANPSSAQVHAAMSPELEQMLSMLSSHRSVLGYLLITRGHPHGIIRHSGVVFEGDQGKRYASVIARIVESVQTGLEEVRGDDGLSGAAGVDTDNDEVRFMRIRTKRHEIMISPDDRYLLAVLQDPST